MLTFLASRRRDLLSGVLFLPGIVALAFAGLGLGMPAVDALVGDRVPFAFEGDHAAARTVLSTIASSLITVAALSFSLTLVTLQLVSSQFTPRAIRGLLGERAHQLTFGAFVGIFIYCLLVMRVVRAEVPVPGISVAIAIALGVFGLLLLVLFIHNLSASIKVSHIASSTARATLAAIQERYPRPYAGRARAAGAADTGPDGISVNAWQPGYIQSIEEQALIDAARTPMHVRARPGDFVTGSAVLVTCAPGADAAGLDRVVREAIHVAEERDIEQDPAYGMRLLADIALRALSPGVNDPTTAVTCIHYLGTCFEELVRRDTSPRRTASRHGTEVLLERVGFEEHLDLAFGELVSFASGNARVARELAVVLERAAAIAAEAGAHERERAVRSLAEPTRDLASAEAKTERDRDTAREGPAPPAFDGNGAPAERDVPVRRSA